MYDWVKNVLYIVMDLKGIWGSCCSIAEYSSSGIFCRVDWQVVTELRRHLILQIVSNYLPLDVANILEDLNL